VELKEGNLAELGGQYKKKPKRNKRWAAGLDIGIASFGGQTVNET
jgi:hypothetical protein